jgi:hypothetical protein
MPTDNGWPTNIRIGASIATMADVKIEPHVEFIPAESIEEQMCGGDDWRGQPRCRWTYPDRLLTGEQFYQLKSLVGDNASASVYIDIPTWDVNPATYTPVVAAYSAVMHWPEEGVKIVRLNQWELPEIMFTGLVGL